MGFLNAGAAVMIISIPFIALALIVLMLKVKETKGVDLDKVGQEN